MKAEIIAFPLHRAGRRRAPLENVVIPFTRVGASDPYFEIEQAMLRVTIALVSLAGAAACFMARPLPLIDIAERID